MSIPRKSDPVSSAASIASQDIHHFYFPVIAVVIPAYCAEKQILKVLAGIPAFVSFVVVVDDSSPDKTSELVHNLNDPRVHLVSHQTNQGVGGAVLSGYNQARLWCINREEGGICLSISVG